MLKVKPGAIEQKVGVVAKYDVGSSAAIELRVFFSVDGVTREDPVTGSLNASVAEWMLESGQLPRPTSRARVPPSVVRVRSSSRRTTARSGSAARSTSLIKGAVDL